MNHYRIYRKLEQNISSHQFEFQNGFGIKIYHSKVIEILKQKDMNSMNIQIQIEGKSTDKMEIKE